MGGIYSEIKVDGRPLWTLFDTGSKNNYIVNSAIAGLPVQQLKVRRTTGLGGEHRTLTEICDLIAAEIEGKSVDVQAYVTEELGVSESGRPIELLFGALSMQNWGIVPVPHEERLDLSHYPTEFIEY